MSKSTDSASPRERIVASALTEFAAKGYSASSVQDIANAAGMSKQALMYHFPTKALLRDGVYGLLAEGLRAQLPEAATELVSRSKDRYRRLMQLALRRFCENPEVARFLVFELLEHPDELMAWLRAEAAPWLGLIRGVVEQWSDVSPDHDTEAHLTSVAMIMLAQAALVPRDAPARNARVEAATLRLLVLGSELSMEDMEPAD